MSILNWSLLFFSDLFRDALSHTTDENNYKSAEIACKPTKPTKQKSTELSTQRGFCAKDTLFSGKVRVKELKDNIQKYVQSVYYVLYM